MKPIFPLAHSGVVAALAAALLFGAAAPLAKWLLQANSPWMVAGLFYLGSGMGLAVYRRIRGAKPVHLQGAERGWLAGAIAAGGIAAPVLLMFGLTHIRASDASLLLNAEGVFTTLLAWCVFRENFDKRIALGMLAIAIGSLVLSWPHRVSPTQLWPAVSILAACMAWGLDNNLTRKISLNDASWIASTKGMVSGTVNFSIALLMGTTIPDSTHTAVALVIGFLSYGVSLTLFVVALRGLGTARAGAYFSVAPFFGAVLALAMGENVTVQLLLAGALMAIGIWLHLTENHHHRHVHMEIEHDHEHTHGDGHHMHTHADLVAPDLMHRHPHRHVFQEHAHRHFPDAHHLHRH